MSDYSKCPKCGAPAKHMPPDGDFKFNPFIITNKARQTSLRLSDAEMRTIWRELCSGYESAAWGDDDLAIAFGAAIQDKILGKDHDRG